LQLLEQLAKDRHVLLGQPIGRLGEISGVGLGDLVQLASSDLVSLSRLDKGHDASLENARQLPAQSVRPVA